MVTTAGRPGCLGATSRSLHSATLTAAATALRGLLADGGAPPTPVILRFPTAATAACAANLAPGDPSSRRLLAQVHGLCSELRVATGGSLWLATWPSARPAVWGQRASALALTGHRGLRSPLTDPEWAGVPLAPPPAADDDECPVCFDDFTDTLPSQDARSRSRPRLWACNHCICRQCDSEVEASANTKCPLCRALRQIFLGP